MASTSLFPGMAPLGACGGFSRRRRPCSVAALMLLAGLICGVPVRAGAAPAKGSLSSAASTAIPAGLPVATFTSPVPPDCTYLQAPPMVFCTPTAFGQALAISGNGSEVAAGDPNYGAVAIYTVENGSWPTKPTALFRGPSGFGSAVALSSDGQTLAVGDRAGVVLVYSQQDAAWPATPTASLVSPGGALVTSLALSADGETLLVSGARPPPTSWPLGTGRPRRTRRSRRAARLWPCPRTGAQHSSVPPLPAATAPPTSTPSPLGCGQPPPVRPSRPRTSRHTSPLQPLVTRSPCRRMPRRL